MNQLFQWCTSLSEKMAESRYYNDYFSTSILSTAFFWGVGIALVFALIFYLIVGNVSFKLSKRWCWLLFLMFAGIFCAIASYDVMVGTYDGDPENSTGFFASIDSTKRDLLEGTFGEDRDKISLEASNLVDSVREGNELIFAEISLMNALYSVVFFFIFSLLLKRFSIHAKAIPW